MNLQQKVWKALQYQIPRILTQFNRDEDSPSFGSFDRNYWNYKIRDFSSVIIQQGLVVLESINQWNGPENEYAGSGKLTNWIDGGINFWAKEQLRSGAFNEYYPYEEGFPPTAFSVYAIGWIFRMRKYPLPDKDLKHAIIKSCKWLLKHPEKEAYNQEAACLAGITMASKIPGVYVDEKALEQRISSFFNAQSDEGWFPEYGGPDLGYLSVTIDCLWDYYDITGDIKALEAINKAIDFISYFVSGNGETPVMTNSRNTDYLVPYGIARSAEKNPVAHQIIHKILHGIDNPGHFLYRTDDRYACHYIFQSFFRSLPFLKDKFINEKSNLPAENKSERWFKESGLYVRHHDAASIFISLKKGGIISIYDKQGIKQVDYGWRSRSGKAKVAVTHWQDESYTFSFNEKETKLVIYGEMTVHGWMEPTPFKHIILRVTSFIFGNRLIPILKRMMIFGTKRSGIDFNRVIDFSEGEVHILDEFRNKTGQNIVLTPAPHYSLRHVSSAGRFVPEELIKPANKKIQIPAREKKTYSFKLGI